MSSWWRLRRDCGQALRRESGTRRAALRARLGGSRTPWRVAARVCSPL